jgi:hypothetical protein
MERSETTPDEFIASLPDDVRADIATLDQRISQVMKGEERVMWEGKFWGGSDQRIIGYGEYRYPNRSGKAVDWFLVGLASQKNYLTVFVNAAEGGAYLAERYTDRLGKVKVGRSSISFKRLSDLNLAVLVEVVSRARDLTRAMPSS